MNVFIWIQQVGQCNALKSLNWKFLAFHLFSHSREKTSHKTFPCALEGFPFEVATHNNTVIEAKQQSLFFFPRTYFFLEKCTETAGLMQDLQTSTVSLLVSVLSSSHNTEIPKS